jgi:diguanylate cyclase (GGDEF)-like protein
MATDRSASLTSVDAPRDAGIARSRRAREELAKSWILEVLQRTPLAEMEDVPIAWIVREGPALIADIVRGLSEPISARDLELAADGLERVGQLRSLRPGGSAMEIPRDLAALQTLLIEALRRDVPERQVGAFASSVERLAQIFGDIQAQVSEQLVTERSGGAPVDPLTGLPGQAELHEWIRMLLTEHRRHGRPFSLILIDCDGLGRINEAYGREAGDRMLRAVSALVCRKIRSVDRAFRLDDDELCVLAPDQVASEALPVAELLWELVDRSQASDGPLIAITAGIASCPEHGEDAESLLSAAEEASWAAKAAGRGVAVGSR